MRCIKKMRTTLCVMFMVACVLAAKNHRRNKPPFIADAVGNTLPPPSVVPATVGSPVNLLTPDRYEFYTFDESGELVKRLMTLEEIQAIVAAGEDGDTPVTFDNDDGPTIAFNFSQPSNTKVHSVVTNVQNVLKAQMEAHKNRPFIPPTLDTPDVSDSWSLILPSIFGNTGVDIIPEKTTGFTSPETETYVIESNEADDNLSKEGSHILLSSSTISDEYNNELVTEKSSSEINMDVEPVTTTSKSTTTTKKAIPTTVITTKRPTIPTRRATTTRKSTTTTTTTTKRPFRTTTITSTTKRPTTTVTTTTKLPTTRISTTTSKDPITTTTTKIFTTTRIVKPSTTTTTASTTTASTTTEPASTTTTSTTAIPTTTTFTTTSSTTPTTTTKLTTKPTAINTSKKVTVISTTTTITEPSTKLETTAPFITTTLKPVLTNTIKTTTVKPDLSSVLNFESENYFNIVKDPVISNNIPTIEKIQENVEKISTFIPISTTNYVTERINVKETSNSSTESDDTEKNNLNTLEDIEKVKTSTVTAQVPFTTVSSTELPPIHNSGFYNGFISDKPEINNDVPELPMLPLFDVAQSISQIASDLGGSYQPLPTTNELLDTTKYSPVDLESKENLELDIPLATEIIDTPEKKNSSVHDEEANNLNFVKITTFDPHPGKDNNRTQATENSIELNTKIVSTEIPYKEESTIIGSLETTMDPVLSGSMNDLLSQVVHQNSQSFIDTNTNNTEQDETKSTEVVSDITTEVYINNSQILSSNSFVELQNQTFSTKVSEYDKISNNNSNIIPTTNTLLDKNINEKDVGLVPKLETMEKPELTQDIKNDFEQITVSLPKDNPSNQLENKNDEKFGVKDIINNNERTDTQLEEFTTEIVEEVTAMTQEDEQIKGITSNETITTEESFSANTVKNIESKPTDNKLNIPSKSNVTKKYKPTLLPKIDDPIKVEEFKKKIQKVNIAEEELISERNNSWKLISTGTPPKVNEVNKDKIKFDNVYSHDNEDKDIILEISKENQGLEVTIKDLEEDIAQFSELCNELAFRYWNVMIENFNKNRSFVMSPYSITSMLAMIFMGAKGATSGEMNDILKLDDMVTFNPHFTLKNISDSIETTPQSGVIVSAFIRELYSDRNKGKILTFYKERAQHFYNGHVEEINFKLISDIIRRRTNLLVKRFSWGRIPEFMKTNTIVMQPPLAAFSANIFQTDCTGSSVEGRDGEMYFVVSPNVRQRRLVPVPAVVYKAGFLAGYDPVLDATAAAVGTTNSIISTMFLMPGQQGNVVHADDLEKLEQRLLESNPTTPTWNRLLRTLLPRIGLELQIPRFSHKSMFNVSTTLRAMGLKELFDADHADLGGLNGPSKDLYLSDMIQSTSFVTCGEGVIGEQHHIEEYPEGLSVKRRRTARWAHDWDEPRDYQRAFHDPHDVGDAMNLPLHLRPRQARLPTRSTQPARLKYDRPFLYFVRHNPSGMILYVGRYNPRLLP